MLSTRRGQGGRGGSKEKTRGSVPVAVGAMEVLLHRVQEVLSEGRTSTLAESRSSGGSRRSIRWRKKFWKPKPHPQQKRRGIESRLDAEHLESMGRGLSALWRTQRRQSQLQKGRSTVRGVVCHGVQSGVSNLIKCGFVLSNQGRCAVKGKHAPNMLESEHVQTPRCRSVADLQHETLKEFEEHLTRWQTDGEMLPSRVAWQVAAGVEETLLHSNERDLRAAFVAER